MDTFLEASPKRAGPYRDSLGKQAANYVPLSPLSFLPNAPAMYEAHFGVPMTGAVLNTLNTRLDAEAIAFQLTHGEAKVFITDREFSAVAQRALSMLEHRLLVIDIDDPLHQGGT